MTYVDSDLPFISVVVSHLNSARTIVNCLERLSAVDYPKDKFEVIVVDAGSVDGSIALVTDHSFSNVRQIVVRGCTEAEGQSLGIEEAKGDVIMFTNSDIYVPPDWIRRHIGWLARGYDLVGGAVFWSGDKYTVTWNQPLPKAPYYRVEPGLGLGFSNCSVRKTYLRKVGGLRNLSSQHDAEFTLRCLASGARLVLDPGTEVYHDHPFRTFFENFKRSYGYAINHITVVKAMFGKVVAGSGMPVFISTRQVFTELTGIRSLKTYGEILSRAKKWNCEVQVGPAEFVFIRLFSTKLGQLVAILMSFVSRKVTLSDLKELHTSEKSSERPVPRNQQSLVTGER